MRLPLVMTFRSTPSSPLERPTRTASNTIRYDSWRGTAQTAAQGGSYRASNSSTASSTLTFSGTSIDWITALGDSYGEASVKIDGASVGTFNLYSSSQVWQETFPFGPLASGAHTIKIQVIGKKKSSSSGTKVLVDGFTIYS